MEKKLKDLIREGLNTATKWTEFGFLIASTAICGVELTTEVIKFAKDCDEAAKLRDALTAEKAMAAEGAKAIVEMNSELKKFVHSFETDEDRLAREKREEQAEEAADEAHEDVEAEEPVD